MWTQEEEKETDSWRLLGSVCLQLSSFLLQERGASLPTCYFVHSLSYGYFFSKSALRCRKEFLLWNTNVWRVQNPCVVLPSSIRSASRASGRTCRKALQSSVLNGAAERLAYRTRSQVNSGRNCYSQPWKKCYRISEPELRTAPQ